MPKRDIVFKNGSYYHVYDKCISELKIFQEDTDCRTFLYRVNYYRYKNHSLPYSQFVRLGNLGQIEYVKEHFRVKNEQVKLLSYCLIPNHYHLLLMQKRKNGIVDFIGRLINSYTKYYNTKYRRNGSIVLQPFRSKYLETKHKMFYVSRYIHLNPIKHGLSSNLQECIRYKYSSMSHYIRINRQFYLFEDPIKEQCEKIEKTYLDYCKEKQTPGV